MFTTLDSTQTGVGFVNRLDPNGSLNFLDYLYYYNGAGVATGDFNNDGLVDLFFVSNQGKNKLYLNKGGMKFEDISEQAGIGGFANWKTGVTLADVNADGLLDIYICAVGNYKNMEGSNELYINNGNMTFSEKAADYGLDFSGFATQAAFFDYDKDGDLDCYLLNHAVHTSRSYDKVNTRVLGDQSAGDYLYRNDGKRFTDVSQQAGIYQAAMGYGLGVSVADLNNDGWEDIFVSNDFHEDDYYYINQRNGTFKEGVKEHFRHLSRFSMGSDIADVNNDGYQDVMTLDMYPDDETVEKSSTGEDPFDTYLYKLQFGYFNQYSRNCLQISHNGEKFSDVAAMAGVVSTDWSWAPLLADYDNDGLKDLFVTNGIVKRPNDLDYIKYIASDSIRFQMDIKKNKQVDKTALDLMPDGKVHNYMYRGTPSLLFEDKSAAWGFDAPNYANGAAYADLDNDGDLDLVTNNINEQAGIYRNEANTLAQNNYLNIQLKGNDANTFGIGTKVFAKAGGQLYVQQLYTTRGFLSAVAPRLHLGVGKASTIDSLVIIWPNQQMEIRTKVAVNQTLTLQQADAKMAANDGLLLPKPNLMFEDVSATFPLTYQHKENIFFDFNRESLIPFKVSTEGPKVAVGDVNGDGLDDVYLCAAKFEAGQLLIQQGKGFVPSSAAVMRADSASEDVDAVFFDADGDKDLDLYVVSGGNEYYDQMTELFDRLYLNDGKGNFSKSPKALPPMFDNKACAKPFDYDRDGDLDLFVGGRTVGYGYGKIPKSYLLVNNGKGVFADRTAQLAPLLQQVGMVTDAVWADMDQDGDADLTVVGDWMPITIFENDKGKLSNPQIVKRPDAAATNGFWQSVVAADFDQDGDLDLMAGNLGTNTKLRKAGDQTLLRLYVKDFDKNGSVDQILTYNRPDGKRYTTAFKDELGKQLPGIINKKFTVTKEFAGKTVEDILPSGDLDEAEQREVNTFESVWVENGGNKTFSIKPLLSAAQVSKIFKLYVSDLNQDGIVDVLLGGNFYGVSTYQGRYDASYGLLLKGKGKGQFEAIQPTISGFMLDGEIRDIKPLRTAQGSVLVVARNNDRLQVFKQK